MVRGTRFRLPRRVKKARSKMYGGPRRLTAHEWELLARCLVIGRLGGWKHVRHSNAHVAMGDTSSCRRRELRERIMFAD